MRASQAAWSLALVVLTATACGARTGLLVPSTDGGGAPTCLGTDIPLEPDNPVLYFVLDHSASMQENGKWTNVRSVIADLITQLGPQARFGAAIFPPSGAECTAGGEVMPERLGDTQGVAAGAFLAATSSDPSGGTPTAATVTALTPELSSFPERTVAILATDGGPNCDSALSCDVGTCTSNIDGVQNCPLGGPPNCCDAPPNGVGGEGCLDGTATTAAVTALAGAGVNTFVLGIPGSAPYAQLLDALAVAGNTARPSEPRYYSVDSADTTALGAAFAEVAAQATASCTFVLSHPPVSAGSVNVLVGGPVVPEDGPNGWTLDGTRLTLLGNACSAVTTGMQAVQVQEGCATVTE